MGTAAHKQALWEWLTWVPSNADLELVVRGAFLARLLAFATPCVAAIGMGFLPFWLRPDSPTDTWLFWLGLGCVVLLTGCFVVNRLGRYTLAAWTYVLGAGFAMHLAALEHLAFLNFFVSLSLVAFALLPLRAAAAVALGASVSASVTVVSLTDSALGEVVVPLCLNGFIIALLLALQLHQRALEHRRLSALRAREQWFSTTLNSIGDAVLTVAPAGNITFMNAVAEQLTGYSYAEALGKKASVVFRIESEESGGTTTDPIRQVLERSSTPGQTSHATLVARNGTKRSIADSGAPIVDAQGVIHGVVVVFRDVSKEHALQARVEHAQRLDALGRLAGGIAHDFNNLLTAIGGGNELACEMLPEGHAAREELALMRHATERAEQLTGQLLAFSRRQVMQPKALSLNDAILASVQILKRTLPETISIIEDFSSEAGWVRVDAVQLEQVLINLAVNAGDAMPRGGTLTISTTRRAVSSERPAPPLEPGNYACLEVRDTGCGMDPTTLSRAFEPFFTTKGPHEGTGLGLATVYGIVQQSGGAIVVESSPEQGSTFSVLLPSSPPPANIELERLTPGAPSVVRTQVVFLVEDEPAVRRLALRALSRDGYRLLEAASGEQALSLLEAQRPKVDLLVTDIVMPGMSGVEVAAAFRQRIPGLRVLYTSGYANEILAREGISDEQSAFLAKPFVPATLRAAVHAALEMRVAPPLPSRPGVYAASE